MCSAYIGERACKLTRVCDKIKRHALAVERQNRGAHPVHGTNLCATSRRLGKNDVGCFSAIDGSLEANVVLVSHAKQSSDDDVAAVVHNAVDQPLLLSYDDDDQMGLGLHIE